MGSSPNEKQIKHFQKFKSNLLAGIGFYKTFLMAIRTPAKTMEELCFFETELLALRPANGLKA
jgi:hypothetical protein